MIATAVRPDTLGVTREQVNTVQSFMSALSTQEGYRAGQTTTPSNPMRTFEVSSWVQIPNVLKALGAEGTKRIKIDFPEPSKKSKLTPDEKSLLAATQQEIKTFIEAFHSKPCSELLGELASKIEASKEFGDLKAKSDAPQTGAHFIAACKLGDFYLSRNLQVTNVINVTTEKIDHASLLAQAHHAVTKSRNVVYQLDGSQGAASKLYESLRGIGMDRNSAVWVGSTTSYNSHTSSRQPQPVTEINLRSFMEREQKKAPILQAIDAVTSQHKDVYFELTKIKVKDLEALDRDGNTVLDNLNRILLAEKLKSLDNYAATSPSPENLTKARASLLAAAIERLYHPGAAAQDRHGTCGAESILRLVGTRDVGEWSRLVADLIVKGECKVRNDITLQPAEDWIYKDISKSRDPFDKLLQSALMRFAAQCKGDRWSYRNEDDKFVDSSGTTEESGMANAAAEKLISGLLREKHTFKNASELTGGASLLDETSAIRLGNLASQVGGIYIALRWPCADEPDGAHAVVLEQYDADKERFIFSNPHGEHPKKKNGNTLTDGLERTIVNNEFGQQAVTLENFKKACIGAMLPAN